jgi:hypothetical protein
MITGAKHQSAIRIISPGDFPKDMKSMSHAKLNRTAPKTEATNLVIEITKVLLRYSERNNENDFMKMTIYFTNVVPNGWQLSCHAEYYQIVQNETSSYRKVHY